MSPSSPQTSSGTVFSNIPIPDPSVITQRFIDRAKDELQHDYESKIAALSDVLITRLTALEQLTAEKFAGIGRQINERDIRNEQDKRTGETAIAAAFQAQKEAAGKSEILATKLIDSLQAIITSNMKTTDDKIAVINARLDKGTGGTESARTERIDQHLTIGSIVGISGGVIGVLSLLAVLVFGVINISRQTVPPPTIVSPAVIPVNPK